MDSIDRLSEAEPPLVRNSVSKPNSLSRAHYRNPLTLPTARRLRWNRTALKRAFPA
jgi:hypothetical protein